MAAREIVEEPGFREDCDAVGDVEQMDAALNYITHVVALNPTVGVPIGESGIWAMPSRILANSGPHLQRGRGVRRRTGPPCYKRGDG
jgi:hypothetical protein